MSGAEAHVVALLVTCVETASIQVSFEPAGAQHEFRPGDAFRVEIAGPTTHEPEIAYAPDWLSISA